MNRKLIRTLYKNKLSMCNKFGYKYGDWLNVYYYNNFKFLISNEKTIKFLDKMNNEDYVKCVANYIRYEYKNNKNLNDIEKENINIDYSFFILKNMKYILKKEFLY